VAATFHWLDRRGVLYPDHYAWFVLFSALDVMLTWLVLSWGWREVNPVAQAVVRAGGLRGLLAYKLALVVVFVVLCEVIGGLRRGTGLRVARVGVGLSVLPLLVTLGQIALAR
jgi:hypothetical protein